MLFEMSNPMDVEDSSSHFLGSLDGDLPALRNLVDQPSGMLWEPTPSHSLMLPGESMEMPLEFISVAERRRSDPRHQSICYRYLNAAEEVPHGMRVSLIAATTTTELAVVEPIYTMLFDVGALSGSFSVLSTQKLRPSPLTLKSASPIKRSNLLPSPPLSPLSFGSPRLNSIDPRYTVSPHSLPTSPRWAGQNLPAFA
ncbi:hypothetical protein D9757_009191 [Collybiopsis confluens]|uniref:Uncharacterized protein n=1 Tax=Collybiopsis confluens TaxID=2823264 RepID=A0A8H5HAH9_9AGAR|nr:hypothetical protein D9757_009191 [Collybiopsis confluens]